MLARIEGDSAGDLTAFLLIVGLVALLSVSQRVVIGLFP